MAAPSPALRVRARRRAGDPIRLGKGRSTEQDQDEVLQSVQRGDYVSNQIADPFQNGGLYETLAGDVRIMPPPVNLAALLRMPNDNSILRQCIEAMVINVEGHGWRLEYIGPDGEDQSAEAKAEKENIEAFLPSLHPDLSVTELRKRLRWDVETLGFAFMEVGRSSADKLPIFIDHIPAHTMRMTTVDMAQVPISITEPRFGKNVTSIMNRRFRRFVQIVGTKKIYFKEFGDPRIIDPNTGKVNTTLAVTAQATEIVMLKQYYPGQIYGLPRWFNNLVAIQGSRQAELTNLDYFKDNAIPAMAVLVSGGSLANDTISQIEEHVTAARGRAAQNRVLVIEVEGDENAASKDGTIPVPKVVLQPMTGDKIKEGQFLAYDAAQIEKVRSSFRLPPIFTGHSQDYTRASAQTSYEVAEGQVFGPEREYIDDILNRQILSPYGVKFWAVRSNPPRISDPDEIIAAVEAFTAVGAMTPNVAIGLANEQFGLDIPAISDEWGNFPFPIIESLAGQGKLIGFEAIMKDTDIVDDLDAADDAAAAGAPGKDTDMNPDTGKEIKDGSAPKIPDTGNSAKALHDKRAQGRVIRAALRQLGTVLSDGGAGDVKMPRVQARARTRSIGKHPMRPIPRARERQSA